MFYAHHNPYGLRVVYERHNGTTDHYPGFIVRFPKKAERDNWVAQDGSHRRVVSYGPIRKRTRCPESHWYFREDGLEALSY